MTSKTCLSLLCFTGMMVLGLLFRLESESPETFPVANQQPLRVMIGIPVNSRGERAVGDEHGICFPVIVQNVSKKPVDIWAEWNSCGSYIVTLEVTKIGGTPLETPIEVTKGAENWRRNFADPETIEPGEATIREVRIDIPRGDPMRHIVKTPHLVRAPYYEHFPLPEFGSTRALTIRAVLTIPPDKGNASSHVQVWSGKIFSPEHEYVVANDAESPSGEQP